MIDFQTLFKPIVTHDNDLLLQLIEQQYIGVSLRRNIQQRLFVLALSVLNFEAINILHHHHIVWREERFSVIGILLHPVTHTLPTFEQVKYMLEQDYIQLQNVKIAYQMIPWLKHQRYDLVQLYIDINELDFIDHYVNKISVLCIQVNDLEGFTYILNVYTRLAIHYARDVVTPQFLNLLVDIIDTVTSNDVINAQHLQFFRVAIEILALNYITIDFSLIEEFEFIYNALLPCCTEVLMSDKWWRKLLKLDEHYTKGSCSSVWRAHCFTQIVCDNLLKDQVKEELKSFVLESVIEPYVTDYVSV